MKSIISNQKKCFLCPSTVDLEKHHCIFGTANRKKAEQDGLWVYLCPTCHHAVHNHDIRDKAVLQKMAQEHWQARFGSKEDFIRRYGRSYL